MSGKCNGSWDEDAESDGFDDMGRNRLYCNGVELADVVEGWVCDKEL